MLLLLFSYWVVYDSVTPWIAVCQAPLSFTISWSWLRFMSIELVMPSNHLTICHPFSFCLQSFPASGSFSMNQLFASGRQSTWVSASATVFSLNIQGWFPLGLIWSCSPRDSQESSPAPQFESINCLVPSLLYGPTRIWTWLLEKTALTICSFIGKVMFSLVKFSNIALLFNSLHVSTWNERLLLLLLSRFSRVQLCATP